ncbi:MAG: hypothetical protein NC452_18205 [Eubacterium sp.]|nr:hypothetical protein [Eubacterium sp.]
MGFYICIASALILLFFAEIYNDPTTHDRYSVIRTVIEFDRNNMPNYFEMCDLTVMQNAKNGWFSLFIPIITAFCFVPLICDEQNSNAKRFRIFRSSKFKFGLSRYFSCIICGGFAVAFGYAIFCGSIYFMFPHITEFDGTQFIVQNNFNFAKSVLGIFLFGTFWSMPSMFLTAYLRNRYVIMCVPLFFKYGISQSVQKISQNAFNNFEDVDYKLLKLISIINPDSLMYIENNLDIKWVVLISGIFAMLFLVGYILKEMTMEDCGA